MRDAINNIFVDRDPATPAWIRTAILAIFIVQGLASYCRRSRSRASATASSPRRRSACSITCCAWIWESGFADEEVVADALDVEQMSVGRNCRLPGIVALCLVGKIFDASADGNGVTPSLH